jgi:hypothetical protein
MLARARIAVTIFFLAPILTAGSQTLIATSVNVGSPAVTFATTQGVIISSVIIPSAGTTVPTGTVQFLANGSPVGPPYAVGPEGPGITNGAVSATLPISTPGTYIITCTYSGDATHTSATSYNSWTAFVVQNPPTIALDFASPSLTFASGATTGNTDPVSLDPINGFHGALQDDCTITVNAGTPTPAYPATCTFLSASPPNGNPGMLVSITTVAPRNVPVSSTGNLMFPGGAILCAVLVFMPRVRRQNRLWVLVSVLACSVALASLSGCAGSHPNSAAPPITVESSAGSYTIIIQGQAYDEITGDITVFTGSIPLTVT